ncbi:MAG: hypothetical protein GY856_54785 [bacterium]|nr:hypothetical protein [bacterium]
MDLISVIVEEERDEGYLSYDTLGPTTRGGVEGGGARTKAIDVGKLRKSFAGLSAQVSTILQDVKKIGDFELKQVQLQVEISSEGGVHLVGTLKAGIKGAITLTFAGA